ncbi:MAG: glycosyltransferase, partial [Alphaproteobacteria bacterium]|nr:glycosyltransferase [Alphaproteobacteria bacterium]
MATITPLKHPDRAAASGAHRPTVAIVLPVFKHSVLLTEAIRSALAQRTDFPVTLLVVNDGCPFPETHETLLAQAEAADGRLIYLRRANGGLSAARNSGIDYVLAALPSVEAIYFLDADNRLYAQALQRAWDQLKANPQCGWAYPDIDMFGVEINARAPADYSVLKHLAENICEAGSLVRRRLFERGLRFDESMKLGFEDWDFWLQAVGQGYVGSRVDTMGFRYRKRPESMLSNSERDRAEILAYMRRKHKTLYSRETVLAAEHQEAPRFAIHLADRNEVVLATDPTADAPRLAWSDFTARFLGAWADPDREH